jgi:hypothetical protein
LHVKVEEAHDVRMPQLLCGFGLLLKLFHVDIKEVQDLDGCLFRGDTYMLTQIDAGKPAYSEATDQAIAAKLLTGEILGEGHF